MASMGHDAMGTTDEAREPSSAPRSILPLADPSRADPLFPILTPEQRARVARHGSRRIVRAGEVLLAEGQQAESFFVVAEGSLDDPDRRTGGVEEVFTVLRPGQFSGEINMLAGRRRCSSTCARSRTGEVIEVKRDAMLALVQTDSELSDILMRAFILRRVELIAHGFGTSCSSDRLLAGHAARQGVPDPQRPSLHVHRPRPRLRRAGAARRFGVGADEVPVLICRETRRAPQPDEPRDRRLPGLQRIDRRRRACATS